MKEKGTETSANELPISVELCAHEAIESDILDNLPHLIAMCKDLGEIERNVIIARKIGISQQKITDVIRRAVWDNNERFTPPDIPSDEKALRELLWRVSLGAGLERIHQLITVLLKRNFTPKTIEGICQQGLWKYKFFYGEKQPLKPPFEVKIQKGKILFQKTRAGR